MTLFRGFNKIKFELASEKDFYLIEEVLNIFLQKNELNYPFSEYLISYIRGINYIKNSYNLLKLNTKHFILKGYRILFLGGGLSLEKEINFIIRNKNNFIIVCVAAVLKVLAKHDITPSIIITSDSSNIIKEQFLVNDKYYNNSIILASNKTDENVIRLFYILCLIVKGMVVAINRYFHPTNPPQILAEAYKA